MSENVEGTIILEGLVEGRLPSTENPGEALAGWVSFVKKSGLVFSLDIQGGNFSLLPDSLPHKCESIGPDPVEVVKSALAALQKIIPLNERSRLSSTLRSREFRKNEEIQTLYSFSPVDVRTQDRSIEVRTTAPPRPLTREEKRRVAVIGGIMALLLLAAMFFILKKSGAIDKIKEDVTGYDAAAVEVDASAFAQFFSVESKSIKGSTLVLKLKRTADYPLGAADYDALFAGRPLTTQPSTTRPAKSFLDRLALEDVARGHVRVDIFNAKGEAVAESEARINELDVHDTTEVGIRLPDSPRATRVVLTR